MSILIQSNFDLTEPSVEHNDTKFLWITFHCYIFHYDLYCDRKKKPLSWISPRNFTCPTDLFSTLKNVFCIFLQLVLTSPEPYSHCRQPTDLSPLSILNSHIHLAMVESVVVYWEESQPDVCTLLTSSDFMNTYKSRLVIVKIKALYIYSILIGPRKYQWKGKC